MSGRLAVLVAVALFVLPSVAGAAPTAVFGKCPAGAADTAKCGTVAVPLDRSNAQSPTIPIAFVFTPHTGTGAAVSAIVLSNGGPGVSNIASDPLWRGGAPPGPAGPPPHGPAPPAGGGRGGGRPAPPPPPQ